MTTLLDDAAFVERMAGHVCRPALGEQRCACGKFSTKATARAIDNSMPEPTSGCFLWLGAINGHGYGSVWRAGRVLAAPRLVWEEEDGPVPAGLCVLHRW